MDVKEDSNDITFCSLFFGDSDQEEDEELSLEDLQGSGKRILVVEDEKTVREYVTKGLNKSGYDVYSASSASSALEVIMVPKIFPLKNPFPDHRGVPGRGTTINRV